VVIDNLTLADMINKEEIFWTAMAKVSYFHKSLAIDFDSDGKRIFQQKSVVLINEFIKATIE
jgi:hypothetical protein